MVNLLPQAYEATFMTFFFILMRVTAAIFTMPVLGSRTVTRSVRAGFAFWIAVLMAAPYIGLNADELGISPPPSTRIYFGVVDFSLAAICEFLIGYSLGFFFQVLVSTIGLSGEIIGKQAGFSAASVFDPISGEDNFLLAQIKIWYATMIFLIIGGPEMVFRAVSQSFHVIAPGEGFTILSFGEAGFRTLIHNGDRQNALIQILYIMGLRIAMPMIGAMLLISLAEAFIARTAPQLNIMSVGFAIRMSMALFILGNSFIYVVVVFKPYLALFPHYAEAFLGRLAPS